MSQPFPGPKKKTHSPVRVYACLHGPPNYTVEILLEFSTLFTVRTPGRDRPRYHRNPGLNHTPIHRRRRHRWCWPFCFFLFSSGLLFFKTGNKQSGTTWKICFGPPMILIWYVTPPSASRRLHQTDRASSSKILARLAGRQGERQSIKLRFEVFYFDLDRVFSTTTTLDGRTDGRFMKAATTTVMIMMKEVFVYNAF